MSRNIHRNPLADRGHFREVPVPQQKSPPDFSVRGAYLKSTGIFPPCHCRGPFRVIRRAEGPRHPGEIHEMTGYISTAIRFLSDRWRSYHHTRIGLAMNIEL